MASRETLKKHNTFSCPTMVPLPLEIYGLIVEHTPRNNDRVNLSCVSSAIRIEAERLLYRKIHFSKHSCVLDALLERLANTPRLASSVQTLHLEFEGQASPCTEIKLAAALRALSSLVHLHITAHGVQIRKLTQGCTFKLRRFEYSDTVSRVSISLGDFLIQQPLIQHLTIKIFQSQNDLPPCILPNLETLECPAYLGKALGITSRPIQRLNWRSGRMYFTLPPYGPYPTLLVLVIGTHPQGYNLADQCPNLRLLECHLKENLVSIPVQLDRRELINHHMNTDPRSPVTDQKYQGPPLPAHPT